MAKLFYVIGASGAGKDSVLGYARSRIGNSDNCVFAHRYITRLAGAGGENHVALSPLEFDYRSRQGFFAMEWGSHGLRYGIGIEVQHWLQKDVSVVLNGSRGYLEQAKLLFPDLIAVLVRVEPAVLRERLIARGRESRDEIEKRIQRSEGLSYDTSGMVVVDNNEALEVAGEQFVKVVRNRKEQPLMSTDLH